MFSLTYQKCLDKSLFPCGRAACADFLLLEISLIRGLFYLKVPFATIKYCWQDREFTPLGPCAGVHSTTTPLETQRQQHQVVYHIFLLFSSTLRNMDVRYAILAVQ